MSLVAHGIDWAHGVVCTAFVTSNRAWLPSCQVITANRSLWATASRKKIVHLLAASWRIIRMRLEMKVKSSAVRLVVLLATAGIFAVGGTASSAMAADLPGDFTRDGVNIRTNPSGGRDVPVVGKGQRSHAITIHCYVNGGRPASEPSTGNANNLWWYLTDHTISQTGYVWGTLARPTSQAPRSRC